MGKAHRYRVLHAIHMLEPVSFSAIASSLNMQKKQVALARTLNSLRIEGLIWKERKGNGNTLYTLSSDGRYFMEAILTLE